MDITNVVQNLEIGISVNHSIYQKKKKKQKGEVK